MVRESVVSSAVRNVDVLCEEGGGADGSQALPSRSCWVSLKPPPCECCGNPRPADSSPGAGADGEGFGEAVSLGQDLFQALGRDPPPQEPFCPAGRPSDSCLFCDGVREGSPPPPLLALSRCCVFLGFVVVWVFFFLTLNLYSRPNKNHLALFLYSVPLELLALKVGLCGESSRVIQRGSNLSVV